MRREIVSTYSDEQLIHCVNVSSIHECVKRPGYYQALIEALIKRGLERGLSIKPLNPVKWSDHVKWRDAPHPIDEIDQPEREVTVAEFHNKQLQTLQSILVGCGKGQSAAQPEIVLQPVKFIKWRFCGKVILRSMWAIYILFILTAFGLLFTPFVVQIIRFGNLFSHNIIIPIAILITFLIMLTTEPSRWFAGLVFFAVTLYSLLECWLYGVKLF